MLPADRTVVMVMKCSDSLVTMRRLVAQVREAGGEGGGVLEYIVLMVIGVM